MKTLRFIAVPMLAGLLFAVPLFGASWTWDGGGSNNNWSTANNWTSNTVPANDGTANLTFTGSTRPTPNVDTGWSVFGLTFDSGSAFTLDGSAMSLAGNGITVHGGGSSVDHVINNNLGLMANQTWYTSGDFLRVNGTVDLNSYTLTANNDIGATWTEIYGSVNGTGSITVAAYGKLYLYGANTFSGGLAASGDLVLGHDDAAGTGNVQLGTGATLRATNGARTIANTILLTGASATIRTGDDLTFSGVINGPGRLDIESWSTTVLSSSNGFSGGLLADALHGTVAFGHNRAAGTGTLTLTSGAIRADGAARTLNNNVSVEGDIEVTGSLGLTLSGTATLTGDRVVAVTNSNTTTFSGPIGQNAAGRGLTIQAAAGTTVISGNNTFSGGLTLEDGGGTGELAIGHDNAAGTGKLTLKSGTIRASGAARTLSNDVSLRGDVEIAGVKDLTFSSPMTLGGVGLAGNHTIRVTNAGTTTFSDTIGQTGLNWGLTVQAAAGTTLLSSSNTFTGGLTLEDGGGSGVLALGHDKAAGTGTLTLKSGLLRADGGTRKLANNVSLEGDVTFAGSHSLAFTGAVTLSGGNHTLTVNSGAPTTFSGSIGQDAAGRGLTLDGAGQVTFSGSSANTYSGPTAVNAGTLRLNKTSGVAAIAGGYLVVGDHAGADTVVLSADQQIADTADVLVNSSGLLDLNGHDETIQSLTLASGSVTTGIGTLTVGGDVTAGGDPFSASIAGKLDLGGAARNFDVLNGIAAVDLDVSAAIANGSVTKNAPGVMRLSGTSANQYTGDTTVNAGTLLLEKSGGAQAVKGDLIIGDGSGGVGADVVRFAASNQIANTSNVNVGLSGLLDLDGYDETVRSLAMTAGSVATGAGMLSLTAGITTSAVPGSATISGNLNLPGSQPLLVADGAAANDLDISAAISGGILVKNGPGTLRLGGSAANTHVGPTMVNTGTLLLDKSSGVDAVPAGLVVGDGLGGANADVARLGTAHQIANTAVVLVKSSGWFDLDSHSETIGALEIYGGRVTTGASTLTVAGPITTGGTTGAGLISGHLNLNGGLEFRVVADPAATNLVVTAVVDNGSLTKKGSGRLDLAGNNTFTGNANVDEGILALADAGALGSTGVINLNGGWLVLSGAPMANRVKDTASVVFAGGNLQADSATEDFGSLIYTSDSGIYLRPDATHGDLTFSGGFRGGGLLKVYGWVGTPSVAGSDDRLFIGGALAADVLPNIHFDGFAPGAMRTMSNEIVPIAVPEPGTLGLAAAALAGLAVWLLLRKRGAKPWRRRIGPATVLGPR